MPENGLTLRFMVTLDHDTGLGKWTKVEGLVVEYEIQEYKEGGNNAFIHRLPGRRKYQTIKLTRPLDKDSGRVAKLISDVIKPGKRHTAQITALDAAGTQVTAWALDGVLVSKWTGPNFDVGGKDTAFESLELVHNGFLDTGGGGQN